jgi:hypothetical protein
MLEGAGGMQWLMLSFFREHFASFGPELPLSIVRALEAIQNGESWVDPLELFSDIVGLLN